MARASGSAKSAARMADGSGPGVNRERRRYPRQPLDHYLGVRLVDWDDFSAWARDISGGGIGLALDRKVARGDRIVFGLPGDKRQQVEAEVCNVRWIDDQQRYWAGLRWSDPDAAARRLLERFLQALASPASTRRPT